MRNLLATICILTLGYAPGLAADTIRIGVVESGNSRFDQRLHKGISLAIDEIKNSTGLDFEYFLKYDYCSREGAQIVAMEMLQEEISHVIGHTCPEPALYASRFYTERELLYVAVGIKAPNLTASDSNLVFRIATRSDEEGTWSAKLIQTNINATKLAILHSNDDIAKSNADAFALQWRTTGRLTTMIAFDDDGASFRSAVDDLPLQQLDVVYVANLSPADPTQLATVLMERFSNGVMVYNGRMSAELKAEHLGNDSSRVYITAPVQPQMLVDAQAVVEALELDGIAADYYALSGYAAAQAIGAAIAGTEQSDATVNADWIRTNPIDSVLGEMNFRENGDIETAPIALYGWDNGILTLVDASRAANCVPSSPTWKK